MKQHLKIVLAIAVIGLLAFAAGTKTFNGNVHVMGNLTVDGTSPGGSGIDSTIIQVDSITVESIDGDDVAVMYNGSDTIPPYYPYAYRSSGALEINAQTGTTYTLVLTDQSKFITMTNGSANTCTVPPNSSVAFPVGTEIVVVMMGAGTTSIDPGSGVTVNGANTDIDISAQYGPVTIKKLATDTWVCFGKI